MTTWVYAEAGMKHSVIYTNASGEYFRYYGGLSFKVCVARGKLFSAK